MTPIAGRLEAANEVDDARFVPLAQAPELLSYARDATFSRRCPRRDRDPPDPPREGEEPHRMDEPISFAR